jgi:hypothetical protein
LDLAVLMCKIKSVDKPPLIHVSIWLYWIYCF